MSKSNTDLFFEFYEENTIGHSNELLDGNIAWKRVSLALEVKLWDRQTPEG